MSQSPAADVSNTQGPGGEPTVLNDASTAPSATTSPTTAAGGAPTTSADNDSDKMTTADNHVITPPNPETTIVPDIKCVGKEDISEKSTIKAEVQTNDCEASKLIIQEGQEGIGKWCSSANCNLKIFQEGKTMLVESNEIKPANLAEALQSETLKSKLGLTKTETPQSSSTSVLWGILVSGLLVAIGIFVWYFKCQRKPGPKGARLAEEAYPVDQENQGNTLVSEAPLNPPPETQEKPNVNGESPEADKTPTPPPTNGSTAKTADTGL
ncbi:uncharacterized protein si:dkey-261h17.1 isoform X2 [Kryptolebias marmoratus]|nr:uncharacterized protein si:dkey-261h17.1 isoform X2 [Kryptolebias marmoratus]